MTHIGSRTSESVGEIRQPENTSRQFLEVISGTREKADFCIDYRGLSVLMTDEPLLDVIKGLVNTGMRLRFVTKITQENISYCKQLMKYTAAVFHVDRVIGNFLILDGRKYMSYGEHGQKIYWELEKGKQGQKQIIKQVLYYEDNSFINAQQRKKIFVAMRFMSKRR